MKTSISLHPQAPLTGSPCSVGQGGLLCSSRQPDEGLPGFQHLHSAATSLWPAVGHPLEEFAAASLPACLERCLPLQPGLSQHLLCSGIIHARWEASQL